MPAMITRSCAEISSNCSKTIMGIGGDNSWGAEVHEGYWVKAKPCHYTVVIEAVDYSVVSG